MKVRPRFSTQVSSFVGQPCGRTTHVSGLAVETNTLTSCIGVPTCRVKDDQGPSSPSLEYESKHCYCRIRVTGVYQFCAGATAMGVGVAARSRRAKPETCTTSRHCRSQTRVANVDDCILSPLISTPPDPERRPGWEIAPKLSCHWISATTRATST